MFKSTYWALIAALVATAVMAAPQQAVGQRSDVEVWSANCGRCHTIQPPNRYSAKDWSSIVTHMSLTARLTKAETDAVMAFLISAARTVSQGAAASAAETQPLAYIITASSWDHVIEPGEVFAQQCGACHGKNAQGDGPAAVAFNPKPTDLTKARFWSERTDEQIDSVIANGKGAMPPFGKTLAPQVREALIQYLRDRANGRVDMKTAG